MKSKFLRACAAASLLALVLPSSRAAADDAFADFRSRLPSFSNALPALAAAGSPHPSLLDTLAAAHAANGDFEAAIQTAMEALSLLNPTDPLQVGLRTRLDLYRRQDPYRESVRAGNPVPPPSP